MPAHKKPLEQLIMSGSVDKDPKRFKTRTQEPIPTAPLGKPSKYLSAEQKKAWTEIAKNAAPNTLFNSDRIVMELCCTLLVRFRGGLLTKSSELSTFLSLLARMGMTPVDRIRLAPNAPHKTNKAADEWNFTSIRTKGGPVCPKDNGWKDTSFQVDQPCVSEILN